MQFGTLVNGELPELAAAPTHEAPGRRGSWPLPALATWAGCWAIYLITLRQGLPAWAALSLAAGAGALLGLAGPTPWRRRLMAAGFPVSLLLSGAASALPAWAWLLPLALLGLAYPLHAWRDAPLFPTPARALDGLAALAPLAPGARVLDAGCGLGDGLAALRRAYPAATLTGVEWSLPIAALARLRCPDTHVRRGDMWRTGWEGQDLVYLFQRPESLPRAVDKATRELAPGAWLASLEFEAPALQADAVLRCPDGRPVWLYRLPFRAAAAASAPDMRNPTSPSVQRRR